jgi:hypothetical protein
MEKFMELNIGPGSTALPNNKVWRSRVFTKWVLSLSPEWEGKVKINAVDEWGGEIHAIQMTVTRKGNPWPVPVTLRSETVDVLTIVAAGKEYWVVFTEQDRDAVGSAVVSNVAGGLNPSWKQSPEQAARRELEEELGLKDIRTKFDVDIRPLLPKPVLPTPGMINERTYMMLAMISVAPKDIATFLNELQGKRTGVKEEGEHITLHVVPAHDARRFIFVRHNLDAKTLLSLGCAGILGSEQ